MSNKDTFYFSHDYNTREDEKIKELIFEHGLEGYGIFWALIEMLYQNANALRTNYKRIAFELRTQEEKVTSIINDFCLFQISDDIFFSDSVQRRLNEREEKSKKARESANSRWNKKKENANALIQDCERNAIKENKGKENKGNNILLEKESKEKIIKSEIFQESIQVNSEAEERKKVAQKKERYFNKNDFKKKLLDLGVDEKYANDWIQVRKDKRASFTESAIDGIIRECEKHNFPFPEAIRNCAESSWQGFKYEWIINKENGITDQINANYSQRPISNGKVQGRSIVADRISQHLARNSEGGNHTIDIEANISSTTQFFNTKQISNGKISGRANLNSPTIRPEFT